MTQPGVPSDKEQDGTSSAQAGPTSSEEVGDGETLTTQRIEGFGALGFFPADHAVAESGKVYVNGGYWTLLRFQEFPAVFPTCGIVAVLRVPFHKSQVDHNLVIRLEGSQGEPHPMRVDGTFRTAPGLEAQFGEPGTLPIAVSVHGLTFERPGGYRFILEVDDEFIADYSFRVIQVAVPGQAAPSTSRRS